jgi:RHS repeat-associated protein
MNINALSSSAPMSMPNKFKLSGNEEQTDFDWNVYDFNARGYDAVLGRFMQVDPLADEREWLNPYNYGQNNPLLNVDPTGMLDSTYVQQQDGSFEVTYNGTRTDDYHFLDGSTLYLSDYPGMHTSYIPAKKKEEKEVETTDSNEGDIDLDLTSPAIGQTVEVFEQFGSAKLGGKGVKILSKTAFFVGIGVSVNDAVEIEDRYNSGDIGGAERIFDHSVNAVSNIPVVGSGLAAGGEMTKEGLTLASQTAAKVNYSFKTNPNGFARWLLGIN